MRAWLMAPADPEELYQVATAMKWLVTGLLFLIAFYGGLDPVTLDSWND